MPEAKRDEVPLPAAPTAAQALEALERLREENGATPIEDEWYATLRQHIESTAAELEAMQAQNRLQENALEKLSAWARAYPLTVFPEPDFSRAHEVLTAAGMTLDSISASNMRYVITQVQAIVDAALNQGGK